MSIASAIRSIDSWGPKVFPWVITVASFCFAAGVWWNSEESNKTAVSDTLKNHEAMINELKLEMKGQRAYIDTRLTDISRDIQAGNQLTAKMSGQIEIMLRRQGVTP